MKTENVRFISSCLLLALPFLAQAQYSKNFTQSFPALSALAIAHERGNLSVQKAPDNQIRYELNVSFEARSEEDAQRVFEAISVVTHTAGSGRSLTTAANISGMVSINGRTTLKLRDGTKIRGIEDLEMDMIVYTPDLDHLTITHKYNKVQVADYLTKSLTARLNSCDIALGSISGQLTLDAKYTEGNIGQTGSADLTLYDCDLTLADQGNVTLQSKYSELVFSQTQDLSAQLYDEEVEIERIDGELSLQDKYSEIKIGACGNARLDVYDSQLNILEGGNIFVKSKYTEFVFGRVYVVDMEVSYDDEWRIEQATSLLVRQSKYSDFRINLLTEELDVDSYDDEIRIYQLGNRFTQLSFNGHYTELDIDMPNNFAYRLKADTQYGDLKVNEDQFDFRIWKEKGDLLIAEGQTQNALTDSPLFTIAGKDNEVRLK